MPDEKQIWPRPKELVIDRDRFLGCDERDRMASRGGPPIPCNVIGCGGYSPDAPGPCERCYTPPAKSATDSVNNPAHYTRSAIEPRDAITAWGLNFNRGCVVKHVARAGFKGDELVDLEKARNYLDYEIERIKAARR